MGHQGRREKGIFYTKIGKLGIVLFMVSLAIALTDTVWAIYISKFFSGYENPSAIVGFLTAFFTIISFFSFFFTIPVIERFSKSRLYVFTLISSSILYICLYLNKDLYIFVIIGILLTVIMTLRVTTFGIIVRDKSSVKKLPVNEGLMYAFMNSAWLVGPLLAGYLSSVLGINSVFVFSAMLLSSAVLFFNYSHIKDDKIKHRLDTDFFKNLMSFFRDKDRILAYILGGGVNFWWSLIFIFMPLYILQNNLNEVTIGFFLFFISLPLISLDYFIGKKASKIGFRKIFRLGFLIPSLLALICFFVSDIYIIMFLLVISSIGLALLESTTESYFFEILKKGQDSRYYGPYNTTIDLNHFISRLLASLILLFLPFRFVFLLFSLFMFIFFIISFYIKEIDFKRRD